jgi:hypothetical protein
VGRAGGRGVGRKRCGQGWGEVGGCPWALLKRCGQGWGRGVDVRARIHVAQLDNWTQLLQRS